MNRTIRELLPLSVVTAGACLLTLYVLDVNASIGRWILAALLFAHGWVHLMFVFPRPTATAKDGAPSWPFDLAESWLVTRARMATATVRVIGKVLIAITLVGFLAAALSTGGVLVPAAWWPALVVASAAGSALLLGLCFSPTLLLGLAIDVSLAWLVVSGAWSPANL